MLCYTQYVASFFEYKGLTKLTLVTAANRALGEDYNDLSIFFVSMLFKLVYFRENLKKFRCHFLV